MGNQSSEIVIASGNTGKIAEFQDYFNALNVEVISQDKFQVPEAIEDGIGFVENALIKARNAAKYTDLPIIADDSGIIIDALDGEPGVISARYAGENASAEDNINKVINKMTKLGIESSPARFHCVLVLLKNGPLDPTPHVFTGTWEGKVVTKKSGTKGFGYDPIFIDENHGKSAAEIFEEKKLCSHRAIALRKLIDSDLLSNNIT
jgi:XTP/dITP diphosphohydrolase